MKQSLGLIILQIVNLLVGFLTFSYIVTKVDPITYSLIGINVVIISIIVAFSNSGLDTIGIRNILLWEANLQFKRVSVYISQILFMRTLIATFLQVVIIVPYCMYISHYNYDGKYFFYFILFGISGIVSAVNDSLRLILKSFNHYFYSSLNQTIVNTIGKIVAIYLFILYGFDAYILTVIMIPVLASIPLIIFLKHRIILRYAYNFKSLKSKILQSRHFVFSSYVSYLYESADQLIVSLVLKPEIFASYSIGKTVIGITKNLIENVFDNLTQSLVKYRLKLDLFQNNFEKIIRIQNWLILASTFSFIILIFSFDYFIEYFNLNKYPYIKYMVLFGILSQLFYLLYKVKLNFFAFFYSPKFLLKFTIASSIISILSLGFFSVLFGIEYIMAYAVVLHFSIYLITNWIFKKKQGINFITTINTEL